MRARIAFIAATIPWLQTCALEAQHRFESPQVALPVAAVGPTVDGAIGEDEWAGGARLVGLVPAGRTELAARRAVSWLASDGVRVYFAVKSEAPPDGRLVAALQPADDDAGVQTIRDDSVEVWLDPHHGEKGQGLYQGIFNSLGAVFDRQHDPARKWRGDWRLASKVIDGWWHFEGSVSLASLGVTGPLTGQTWGVRLARNWKNPGEQATWAPLAVQFDSRDTMSVIRWLDRAPVTQMVSNRTPDGAKCRYTLRIANPHAQALSVRARLDSQPESSQHATLAEVHAIGPGQTREVVLDHRACHPEETIYTRIHLDSPDGATVYFHREFTWALARPANVWGPAGLAGSTLDRIKDSLLFHASFDEGPDADFARGEAAAKTTAQEGGSFQLTEGLAGQAMLSGRDCAWAEYANKGNLDIHEGTLSMWVRPVAWGPGEQGDMSHAFFVNGRAGEGYFGVQMARFNVKFPHLQCYMIQYPYRPAVHITVTGEVRTWKPEEWHWLVMTWRADELTFYVDGLEKARRGIDPPLSERDLTWPGFHVGKAGGQDQTAIDEVMIFGRCLTQSELRVAKLFCRSSQAAAAWDAVQLDFGYYPYYGKLKARADINAVTGKEGVRGARLMVREAGATEPVATIRMPAFRDFVSEIIADLPDLAEGRYELALRLDGGPDGLEGELVRDFERRRFEWEHNGLGKSDLILPPFTPLRVDGQTVHAVLREHRLNGQGLWDQVVAKGEPILAGPMQFEAWADGEGAEIREAQLRFTESRDTRVVTQARWSVGEVRAEVGGQFDYDGMMLCTVELSGSGTLDRLDLVIPVRDGSAPLGHFIGERCRDNFAGAIPAGIGVVWDSGETLKHDLIGPFCPYIWVGEEERGIAWFAENDRGWAVDGQTPCQQLEREGGVLTVRVRLVQTPTEMSEEAPRRIVFGLQATPVKPMPERPANWRTWTAGDAAPGATTFTIAGSTHYIGSLVHEPFPYQRDLSLWEKFGEVRRTGEPDYTLAEAWIDRYPEEVFSMYPRQQYLNSVRGGFRMVAQQPDRMLVYVQGRGATFRTPEFQTFQDEWTDGDYTPRAWPTGYDARSAYSTEPIPSWQDFTIWWLKQQMDTFTDGLYFDNFFMIPVKDRVISSAYQLPDGRVQPSVSWANMREMMRRTSTLYIEAGRHPMIGPHMTNVSSAPMMAFAQFGLDWEWHYGRSDFQNRWSRDHIRAACAGRQTGCAPVVIGIGAKGGSAEEVEWLHRTFNGVILTHELIPCWYTVNTFIPPEERRERTTSRELYYNTRKLLFGMGIGTDACRTYNYWEDDYPLTIDGAETSSIVHRGERKIVVVVTDWGDGAAVKARLDVDRLGLGPDFTATDFETGEPVERAGATLTFELAEHDYRTIVVEE